MTTSHDAPRSWRVTTAATLAVGYALVLIAVAIGVLYELFAGVGAIGHDHLDDIAARGAVVLSLVLLAGAGLFVGGALGLAREGRPALLVWPLSILVVVSCIGEIADLAGAASGTSNLIGAAILVLALTPIVLVAAEHRASRGAQRAGQQAGQRNG
ncbi:MAG TPA: hypothetical protein VIG48_10875 [Jatrophihabitans sp.]|jgi:hypothetical protein